MTPLQLRARPRDYPRRVCALSGTESEAEAGLRDITHEAFERHRHATFFGVTKLLAHEGGTNVDVDLRRQSHQKSGARAKRGSRRLEVNVRILVEIQCLIQKRDASREVRRVAIAAEVERVARFDEHTHDRNFVVAR